MIPWRFPREISSLQIAIYNFEIQFCTRKPAFNGLDRLSKSASICVIWNSALENLLAFRRNACRDTSRSVSGQFGWTHFGQTFGSFHSRYSTEISKHEQFLVNWYCARAAFHFPCSLYYSYYRDWSMTLIYALALFDLIPARPVGQTYVSAVCTEGLSLEQSIPLFS